MIIYNSSKRNIHIDEYIIKSGESIDIPDLVAEKLITLYPGIISNKGVTPESHDLVKENNKLKEQLASCYKQIDSLQNQLDQVKKKK